MQSFPFFQEPIQFNLTLDGDRYTAFIRWNFAGLRWFIWLYTSTGDLIMCNPIIESTRDKPINMLNGYFFSNSMIYNTFVSSFELS